MANAEGLELNEVHWWSHWAEVQWIGKNAYVMLSSKFGEYFFNRACFLDCGDGSNSIREIEVRFEAVGKNPHFAVQSECGELVASLEARGYDSFDEMSVMQLGGHPQFKRAPRLEVAKGEGVDVVRWTIAYLDSFYGETSLKEEVVRIVERLAGEPSVTLFAAEENGKTVGVLAAFRSPGLLGLYCVGTVQEHRGRGVAGALIQEAARVASTEGRRLILQTLLSDGVEGFYSKGGFRRAYLKHMMRRDSGEGEGTP